MPRNSDLGYRRGSTNTTVATALRDAINADSGYPVTAFLSGSTLSLTAKSAGASTNYSLSGGSSTSPPFAVVKNYTIRVNTPLSQNPTILPDGLEGNSYSAMLSASGGVPPYNWQLAGVVPAGFVRDATGTAFDYVTATTYANLGPVQQVDLGNGVRTTLSWNKNGEMTSLLTQKVGGAMHLNLAYTYFNNGQIQEIGNGLTNLKSEKYTYDPLRRLFTAQRGPDASIQRKYQYDYDRYGNRWAQAVVGGTGYGGALDLNSSNNRITTTGFSYVNGSGQDQAGNLTANGPGSSYTYNMENFMTAAGSTTYAYDAQGRRVRKTVGGTVTDYFYSGSELLAEKTGTAWTDYIFFGDQRIAQLDIGSIAIRFTNDSCSACSGPPVGGGDRNLFVNSMTIGTTTILPNDPSVSYTAAPCNGPGGMYCSGDMITSAVPSGQTITVNAYGSPDYNIYPHMQIWVNGKLMGEWDVTGTAQNYTATAVRYFAFDHLGSMRACTDAYGNSLGTCDYEPFGEIQPGTTCSVPTNFRFAGMEWDANAGPNGLYHTWFRQYDPNQGRWMAVDAVAGMANEPQTLNRVIYVLNDPVNGTDPHGLWVEFINGRPTQCIANNIQLACEDFYAIYGQWLVDGNWVCVTPKEGFVVQCDEPNLIRVFKPTELSTLISFERALCKSSLPPLVPLGSDSQYTAGSNAVTWFNPFVAAKLSAAIREMND